MKTPAYIVLLLLPGVLLSVGIAHRVVPAREPVYQGKPLDAWLQDLNSTAWYTQDTAINRRQVLQKLLLHYRGRSAMNYSHEA